MVIQINTKKVTDFIVRHKEGVIVGCIAIVVMRAQVRDNKSMMEFISDKGLMNEYRDTH